MRNNQTAAANIAASIMAGKERAGKDGWLTWCDYVKGRGWHVSGHKFK